MEIKRKIYILNFSFLVSFLYWNFNKIDWKLEKILGPRVGQACSKGIEFINVYMRNKKLLENHIDVEIPTISKILK